MNLSIASLITKRLGPQYATSLPPLNNIERIRSQVYHLTHLAAFLKNDPDIQLNELINLTGTHYPNNKTANFELLYIFTSTHFLHDLIVQVELEDSQNSLPTLTPLYNSSNWLERELWDMFGIVAEGHPQLNRLLLYPDFNGHPLRKDFHTF